MQFSIKTALAAKAAAGSVIVPVLAAGTLTASGQKLDEQMGGALSHAMKSGDLPDKSGSVLLVRSDSAVKRAILVSLGDIAAPSAKNFQEAARAAYRALTTLASHDAVSLLDEVPLEERGAGWKVQCQIGIARELAYKFDQMKSKKEKNDRGARLVEFIVAKPGQPEAQKACGRAVALADGVDLAKDLGNLPGNVCTPTYLADAARKLGRKFDLKVEVLDQKQMQALKMGALLAVAQGSAEPPKFIVIQYKGAAAKAAPVALVGKGITFDTGGISIKGAAEMDEMKFDMCGAASVLGTISAVAQMKLPVNVVGIVPTCENMPSGTAIKPGDVVTSMSGQTIEILNTDAEGRLILSDALTFVGKFKPSVVIDIATLTGACVVALGHHHSGMFTAVDALATELSGAGAQVSDTVWRMPLDDDYQDAIKSPFADMANVGGRAGGAITAACFLSRYTKDYDWVHLDIAGTAWKSGAAKGSTGRPVPLLTQFLVGRADGG